MRIRRAEPADLAALVELNRQFCVIDHHQFDATRVEAGFAPLLANDDHGIVLISDDPAGYAVLTWGWSVEAGGAEAVLDEIYLSERGRGHGSVLIDAILEQANAFELARVFLETERHNDRARRLYARHGFVEDDSIWMSHELREF